MKLIETINMQKRQLEDENEDLKSRISELMNEHGSNLAAALERPSTASIG